VFGSVGRIVERLLLPVRVFRSQRRARLNRRRRAAHRKESNREQGGGLAWVELELANQGALDVRAVALSLMDDSRSTARRELFQKRARRRGWDVSFWPAVDGKLVETFPPWVATGLRPSHPEPIGAGELGLIMTVRNLYRWALDAEVDHLIVFEDDAVLHAPPLLEVPEQYDFVFINDLFFGDDAGRLRYGWGTYAYVVSRRGMLKMQAILNHVVEPIDLQIMMYCRSLAELGHYITEYRDPELPQLDCFHSGPLATHANHFPGTIR